MAGISLNQVMQLPALRGARVVAGRDGMGRHVHSVNVMEVPDVEAFVRTGDLLVTTAYPVHHDPSILVRLVKYFHLRGLAALAIKKGRYLENWPEGLLEVCNDLGFPLIELGDNLSFDEVIGEVMAVVLSEYGPEPNRADAIRQQLTEVALSGGGLEDIALTLADALLSRVNIVDLEGKTLALADAESVRNTPEGVPDYKYVESFEIRVASRRKGYIKVFTAGPLTIGQKRLVQQACFAAGMHIAQQQATIEVNERLRALALEEIVRGTDGGESRHQHLFDWPLEKLDTVVAISSAKILPDETVVRKFWGRSALAWLRGEDVMLLCNRQEIGRPIGEASLEFSKLYSHDVRVGVGDAVDEPSQLVHSHSTALEALRIARLTSQEVGIYEELELELLLLSLGSVRVDRFIDRNIGPLITYDYNNKGALVSTLGEVLSCRNGREAAERLFIHYNTLKYRLEQIRDLLGEEWDNPDFHAGLVVAIQLQKLRD